MPPGFTMEAPTQPASIKFDTALAYDAHISNTPALITTQRHFAIGRIDFAPADYPRLRKFYADVAAQDSEQLVLRRLPPSTAAP